MEFLKAKWTNLVLINYTVDPKVLEPFVPKGTQLDLFNNKCYVSLVGFMFENTKVLGIPIPYHQNFEEVNLRFYVKKYENGEWKRGVVFIKEIVPKWAITFIANNLYKEHYETNQMDHKFSKQHNQLTFFYAWKTKNQWQHFEVQTHHVLENIPKDSEAEFITEHYFGYTKVDAKITYAYEVKHPRWQQYKVIDAKTNIDFEKVYGQTFKILNHQKPESYILAKGSEISVGFKTSIS